MVYCLLMSCYGVGIVVVVVLDVVVLDVVLDVVVLLTG